MKVRTVGRYCRRRWRSLALLVGVLACATVAAAGGHSQQVQREQEADDPARRDAWFYDQRAYPKKAIPAGALLRARVQAGRLPRSAAARLAPTPPAWTSIGPRPITGRDDEYQGAGARGGRVTAVAPVPGNAQVAYLGAAAGGVWKTTDGGQTWAPKFDTQASLAIGSVTVDSNNTSVVYAGTGEANSSADAYYGAGIFRSADAGATWSKIGGTKFDNCFVGKIVVKPGDANTILAAVDNVGSPGSTACVGGLYRSLDRGVTWTRVIAADVSDVTVDPHNATTWYAGEDRSAITAAGDALFKSTDSGATWNPMTSANVPTAGVGRVAIAVAPSNGLRLYATIVSASTGNLLGVYTSPDAGATWSAITPASPFSSGLCATQCNYDLALAIDPTDSTVFYLGGVWLYRFALSGSTYSATKIGEFAIHADQHSLVFDTAIPSRMWIGNDGGTYRRDPTRVNPGPTDWTFTNLNKTLSLAQFQPGTSGSTGSVFLGGNQDTGTPMYKGALEWKLMFGGDGGYANVDPTNPQVLYSTVPATSSANAIYVMKSNDGGATLVGDGNTNLGPVLSGFDGALFYPPVVISPTSSQTLYAGSTYLWRTTTGSEPAGSWSKFSPQFTSPGAGITCGCLISAIAQAPSSAQTIYVGTNEGQLQVTTNGGGTTAANWTNRARNGSFGRFVSDIAVAQNTPAEAWVTLSGFNSSVPVGQRGHVFHTTNSGVGWTDVSGDLPDVPVNAIAVDSRQTPTALYAGTDVGVFASFDGGTHWQNYGAGAGLPNAPVFDLRLEAASNKLVAATHGRGAWVTAIDPPPVAKGLKRFVGVIDAADFDRYLAGFAPFGRLQNYIATFKAKYGTTKLLLQAGIDAAVAKAGGDIPKLDAYLDGLDYTSGPFTLDTEATITPQTAASVYDIQLTVTGRMNTEDLFRLLNPEITIDVGKQQNATLFAASATFKLNTTLGDDGFYLTGNQVTVAKPSFSAEADFGATDPAIGGDAGPLNLDVGVLGATVTGAVKASAGVDIFMKDPNTDGKITLTELTSTAPSKLLGMTCSSGGAHVKLDVKATLVGLSAVPGTIRLDDANLCDGFPLPTVALGEIGKFKSLTPLDVINSLVKVTQSLKGFQDRYDPQIPFVRDGLKGVVSFNERLLDFFKQTGLTDPTNPLATIDLTKIDSVSNLQKLQPLLEQALGVPINMRYSGGQLLFDLNLSSGTKTASRDLAFGDQLQQVGLTELTGSTKATVGGSYKLNTSVGFDLTNPTADIAQRVYFSTGGVELSADASASADVDLTGKVVPLTAKLADTNTAAGAPVTLLAKRDTTKPMFSIDLQGYGDNRLTLAEIASSFTSTTPLATLGINAQVPEFGLGAKLMLGTTPLVSGGLKVKWPDVTKLTGADALTVTADADFKNGPLQLAYSRDPVALLRLILQTTRDASDQVATTISGNTALAAKELPLVGGNVGTLVPFFESLRDRIDQLLAVEQELTLENVQAALRSEIAKLFNLTPAEAASILSLRYEPATTGTSPQAAAVVLDINLDLCTATFKAGCAQPKLPALKKVFDLRLGTGTDIPGLAGASVNGTVSLDLGAKLHLGLGLELPTVTPATTPGAFPTVNGAPKPFLLDNSFLKATFDAGLGGQVAASVGPFAVSIGNTALNDPISGYLAGEFNFGLKPTPTTPKRLVFGSTALGTFFANAKPTSLHLSTRRQCTAGGSTVDADACARLPVYLGSTPLTGSNPITFVAPDLGDPSGWKFTGVNELVAQLQSGNFDWAIALEGLDAFAAYLDKALSSAPPNATLPLVGTKISSGAKAVQDFRASVLTPLKTAVATFNQKTQAGPLQTELTNFFTSKVGPAGANLIRPTPVAIKTVTASGNVATFTTTEAHRFFVGQDARIAGVAVNGYDGKWKIVATPTPTTFTADIGSTPEPSGGGTATSPRSVAVVLKCKHGAVVETCLPTDPVTTLQRAEVQLAIGKVAEVSTEPFDIGFKGLRMESKDSLTATGSWAVDATFGIDRTEGFYVRSDNPISPNMAELRLDGTVDFPRTITGSLAFIPVLIGDDHGGPDAAVGLGVDLQGGNGTIGIDQLRDSSPTGWSVKPSFGACANAKFALQTTGVGTEPSRLPSIYSDFALAGGYQCPEGGLGTGAPPTVSGFGIHFTNVELDLGSWFRDFFGPALEPVNQVLGPVRPVIKTIKQPIPGVADAARALGLTPPTWYDALKKYNEVQKLQGQPDQLQLLDTVIALVDVVDLLGNVSASGKVPLGRFDVDTRFADDVPADPTKMMLNVLPSDSVLKQIAESSVGQAAKQALQEANEKAGFDFPAFENPGQLLQMLVGKDVDLVRYDAGRLHAEQQVEFKYPLGPVILFIGGRVFVDGRVLASYDTFGVREALKIMTDGNPANDGFLSVTGSLLKGLAFDDWNKQGEDVPEIHLGAELAAGASLGAKVQGGVDATVDLNLHATAADHKVRYTHIWDVISKPPNNPLCLFDMSGRVGASIAIVIPPIPIRIPVAETTLYELPDPLAFCHPKDPTSTIGTVENGTLVVGATPARDTIGLAKVGPGRVSVTGPFGDAIFSGVNDVWVDGKAGNDTISVAGAGQVTQQWDFPTTMCGGAGDDKIFGGAGPDELFGDGGGQADFDPTISCSRGSGNDILVGNGGFDDVHGGDGQDTLFGDSAPETPGAGRGAVDHLAGDTGDDTIRGGAGSDVVVGNAGNDTLDLTDRAVAFNVNLATGRAVASSETDFLTGIENARGGPGNDVMLGDTGANVLDGGAGADAINGAGGNDTLTGGPGGDFLYGSEGDDDLRAGSENDKLDDGPGNDTLRGEAGSDTYVQGAVANGADSILDGGGAGLDKLDYSLRTNPIFVTFDSAPNDGEQAEGDDVAGDIDQVLRAP